jgi:hypothetical protein
MNAHERRTLRRMAKKASTTTSGILDVRPMDQEDSQLVKADKKVKDKEEGPPKTQTGRALSIAKRTAQVVGTTIGFSAAILGLVTGYVALLPSISVSQNEQLNQNDPFSSPFIVSNDGPLPIEGFRFTCGIGQARHASGPTISGDPNFGTSFIFLPDASGKLPVENFGANKMKPGERSTVPSCNYPFPGPIAGADGGIVVTFRIGYTPFAAQRIFHFAALADTNNKLHWFPYPLK